MLSGGLWDNYHYLTDTYLYNWETAEWRPSSPMAGPRAYHGCTGTPGGEVMVLGGLNNDFYIRTVAVFDPRTEVRPLTQQIRSCP